MIAINPEGNHSHIPVSKSSILGFCNMLAVTNLTGHLTNIKYFKLMTLTFGHRQHSDNVGKTTSTKKQT